MLDFEKTKSLLRIFSLIIFVSGILGLTGTLILHNSISSFNFKSYFPFSDSKILKIICDEKNSFCKNILIPKKIHPLNKCTKQKFRIRVIIDGERFPGGYEGYIETLSSKKFKNFTNQKIIIEPFVFKEMDESCIKNFKIYKLYNFFPYPFEKINQIKLNKDYLSATGSNTINPFLYGETSISNIAKRYPVNYFFKILIFILSITLFLYWKQFNLIFNFLENNKKFNLFYTFGLLSAIFLFFHTLFLGTIFENKFADRINSLFIVFFIIFEILAQIILTLKLYKIKKDLFNIFNVNILKYKIIFILIISTLSCYALYIIQNLERNFENIFEWNFFLFLLVFYILTFFMTKKNYSLIQPPPSNL